MKLYYFPVLNFITNFSVLKLKIHLKALLIFQVHYEVKIKVEKHIFL